MLILELLLCGGLQLARREGEGTENAKAYPPLPSKRYYSAIVTFKTAYLCFPLTFYNSGAHHHSRVCRNLNLAPFNLHHQPTAPTVSARRWCTLRSPSVTSASLPFVRGKEQESEPRESGFCLSKKFCF